MKKFANRRRREEKEYSIGDLVLLSTKDLKWQMKERRLEKLTKLSQLYYGPVVTYCMVYYYTKRATLARLLANEGPAIYVVL